MATAKANLKSQKKILRNLLKLRNDVMGTVQAENVGVKPLQHGDIGIPLTSVDDLIRLEEDIAPEFIKDLKEVLKSKVDDKLYDTALAMLKSIFTIQLMKELNWDGTNTDKTGLAKKAPKLAAAILDGAKEAVGSKWTLKKVKEKLMRILVKAKHIEARESHGPRQAVNAAANDIRDAPSDDN